jgi:hypothetical protein
MTEVEALVKIASAINLLGYTVAFFLAAIAGILLAKR